MARFFQHVEPGELQGKVTRLKYIDDISDDEFILFYFEDGTKCNKDYIGSVNETEDSIKKFVMVELTGPTNQWQFMKKEVHADVSKMMRDDATGQVYEGVGPDVKLGGGAGSQSRTIESVAKDGIRIEITAPRRNDRYVVDPDDNYCLSLRPELETSETSSVASPITKPVVVPKPKKTIVEVDDSSAEYDIEITGQTLEAKPVITNPVHEVPNVGSYIVKKSTVSDLNVDLDNIQNDETIGNICFIVDGEEVSFSVSELKNLLTNKNVKPVVKETTQRSESALITNMIDKSKKKACTIAMNLTLNLPPKEVYDTIKTVYEDGMADEFVESVTFRIPYENLIESLSNGLSAYYNGTIPSKKTNSTVKKEDA